MEKATTIRTRSVAVLALASLATYQVTAMAQRYDDPDSPAVQAAAKAAMMHAKILEIVGVTSDIDGTLKGLGAKVTGQELRIALSADVLFDFDSFALRPDASTELRKVADVLAAYMKSPVLVEGHTDGKGSDQYNQTLSQRRADSVKSWLVNHGRIEASRMLAKGWGKTKPVAANTKSDGSDDPDGRQKNRRVEIVVRK